MKITREMLDAATRRAVELGVLPRRSQMEDLATNIELMQEILQAAVDAADPPDPDAGKRSTGSGIAPAMRSIISGADQDELPLPPRTDPIPR